MVDHSTVEDSLKFVPLQPWEWVSRKPGLLVRPLVGPSETSSRGLRDSGWRLREFTGKPESPGQSLGLTRAALPMKGAGEPPESIVRTWEHRAPVQLLPIRNRIPDMQVILNLIVAMF